MSYSYALPGERFSSGLSRRWLLACTLSQFGCLAAIAGAGALAHHMQWLAGSPEKIGLDLIIAAIFGLTYGYLRGSVLRAGLARFSMPLWCLAAAALALVFMPPVPVFVFDLFPATDASSVIRALSPYAVTGVIYGLTVGGVEALVMRRAAFGLILWVLMSAVAWGAGIAVATLGITLSAPWLLPKFGSAGITLLWSLVMAPLVAILMMPALRNLRPQLSYYGPRVYRPLLRR